MQDRDSPDGRALPGSGHHVPSDTGFDAGSAAEYGALSAAPPWSWTSAPPAGTPFHRMARTDKHRWWRPLEGTVLVAAGAVVLPSVLMFVVSAVVWSLTGQTPDGPPASGPNQFFTDSRANLAFHLAALGLFLPVTMLVAVGVQRRRPGTLSSVAGRLRWKWLLACCGLGVLYCVVAFGMGLVMDDRPAAAEHWVGWEAFLLPAAIIVLLVPFQATAEEYVFRGWLVQAVGACTLETARSRVGRALSAVCRTPWPGVAIGSVLFTAGHGYTGWGMLYIFVFGVLAAWLTVRTGGLEAAIALHVFTNLLAMLTSASIGRLELVQGAVPWQVVVADIAPMVLFAAAVAWLARRMRVQTVTSGPGGGAPAVAQTAL